MPLGLDNFVLWLLRVKFNVKKDKILQMILITKNFK